MRCGGVHLGYCSNIHPAHSWAQTREVLCGPIPRVKAEVSPEAGFGVGLRLSGEAARELRENPGALATLQEILSSEDLYVFTLNGFPYGPFHGQAVKAQVYRPDWREPERERYTADLVEVLAAIMPPGELGTISTVPGCFAPDADADAPERIADALRRQVARLHALHRARGTEIALALEPEPCCLLETIAQTVAFFEAHLLSAAAVDDVARAISEPRAAAEAAIRRHLGVCLDTCHAAVEFEEPRESVAALERAGIRIAKVQATTGLCVRPVDDAAIGALQRFADGVYLHQVVAQREGELRRFVDLPDAFAAYAAGARHDEWRVHFHVPVFLADPTPFRNTQTFLAEALPAAIAAGCTHVEVETYTWDVLPPEHRAGSVEAAIARELRWTRARMG